VRQSRITQSLFEKEIAARDISQKKTAKKKKVALGRVRLRTRSETESPEKAVA
jgi:hypothetical protein